MKTPILSHAGSATGPSTTAARYSALAAGTSMTTWHGSIDNAITPIPVAGKFTKWRVRIDVAPGSGKSRLFELMVNGSADASFKVTIADSATEGSVTVDRSLSAQDLLAIKTTPSGTPAAITVVQSSFLFEGTDAGDSVIFGGNHSVGLSNSAVTYLAPGSLLTSTSVRKLPIGVVSSPGTIDKLTVYSSGNVATGSYAFELYKSTDNAVNWTATGVTCTLSSGRLASDSTHSVSVARGDCLQLVSTPTSTPTSVELRWSCRFVPTTVGESLLFGKMTDAVNSSGDTFFNANGVNARVVGSTESNVYNVLPVAAVAKNLLTNFETAPASGKNRSSTLRVNGADSALTNTISDTATTASDTTHSVSLADNDLIDIKSTASANFPTAPGIMSFGMTLYIAEEAAGPATLRMIYRKN